MTWCGQLVERMAANLKVLNSDPESVGMKSRASRLRTDDTNSLTLLLTARVNFLQNIRPDGS